jgi:antitoxin Phd
MKTNATQFKNHLGEYMQKVYQEPIIVEKSGKPSAVLISYDTFERLSNLEDFYWGMQADQAAKEGFLGTDESERRLKEYARNVGININDERQAKAD